MGIRKQLNEKPSIAIGIAVGIIMLALLFVIYELHGQTARTRALKSPPATNSGD